MKTKIDTVRKADKRFNEACAKADKEFEARWDEVHRLLDEAAQLREDALVALSVSRDATIKQRRLDLKAIQAAASKNGPKHTVPTNKRAKGVGK